MAHPSLTHTLARLAVLASVLPMGAWADSSTVAGQVRSVWISRQTADTGPLAQANTLQPGISATDTSSAALLAELRANTTLGPIALGGSATLQTQRMDGTADSTQGVVNEAYVSGSAIGWQWSAGKKVVSWDVGYAFRPNDLVQNEVRRSLASQTLEGRALLMAEHFEGDTAWSLVWVNPTQDRAGAGAQEAALAARLYQHQGALDWHAFARQGEHTGASLGAAASWVATDSVELHVSVRAFNQVDSVTSNVTGTALTPMDPWRSTRSGAGQQVLIGGTWTNENQVSVLVEAWHDDTALTDRQWNEWTARNQALPTWLSKGVPASAIAGNLAWQAKAFAVSNSLRQDNLFVRLSWQHDRWQTALDVLYTPADQGTMTTASVVWSGESFKLEAGLRAHGGPSEAVVRQLPVQRQGYAIVTWAF